MFEPGNGHSADVVTFGPFSVDRQGGVLVGNDRDVGLPPKAMGVLLCLLERPGALVPKEELMTAVWNGTAVADGSLTEAVRTLRAALGDDPQEPTYIQTVHRRGYRFIAEVQQIPVGGLVDAGATVPAARAAVDETEVSPAVTASGARPRPLGWGRGARFMGTALLGSVLALIGYAALPSESTPAAPVAFTFGPPRDRIFFAQSHSVAISPDGATVVFSATSGSDAHHLYARRLDGLDAEPLRGTVGRWALYPFFSPDGRRVGYLSGRADGLEVVDLASGEVEVLCNECSTGFFGGATFTRDGTVFLAEAPPDGDGRKVIWRVSPGAEPEILLAAQQGEAGVDYLWPHALPDDEWLLVTLRRGHTIEGARIVALNTTSGEHRHLVDDGFNARYVAAGDGRRGHLVFGREGDLWAVAFDAGSPALLGEPVPLHLERQVAMNATDGSAAFDVSAAGVLALHPGVFERREYGIVTVDGQGNVSPLIADRAEFVSARISPDNRRLAACVRGNRDEIRIYDLEEPSNSFRIRHTALDFCEPIWSPDGRHIAFAADGRSVLVIRAAPSGSRQLLVETAGNWISMAGWSPDGRVIYTVPAVGGADIWTVDADCRNTKLDNVACDPEFSRPLLATDRDEIAGGLSPDGNWLALSIDWVVHVMPLSGGAVPVEVSPGIRSRFSPDGDELLWQDTARRRGRLAAPWRDGVVDLETAQPRGLGGGVRFQDLLRDETAVGIDRGATRPRTEEIVVISGWLEELARRVRWER